MNHCAECHNPVPANSVPIQSDVDPDWYYYLCEDCDEGE